MKHNTDTRPKQLKHKKKTTQATFITQNPKATQPEQQIQTRKKNTDKKKKQHEQNTNMNNIKSKQHRTHASGQVRGNKVLNVM